jgi:hypothetical protein
MSCESRRGYVKVFFFENEKIQYLFLFSSPSFWLHTAGPIHTHLREVWMKFLKFLAFTMVLARQNWDKNALDDVKCSDKVEWQRVRPHEAVRHKLRNRQKMHVFVFLVCFWAYVGQPHDYIGWATSMPFASSDPTDLRTSLLNFGENCPAFGGGWKTQFFWVSHFDFFCFIPIKISHKLTR